MGVAFKTVRLLIDKFGNDLSYEDLAVGEYQFASQTFVRNDEFPELVHETLQALKIPYGTVALRWRWAREARAAAAGGQVCERRLSIRRSTANASSRRASCRKFLWLASLPQCVLRALRHSCSNATSSCLP